MTNVSSTVEFAHRFEGAGREATSALIEDFERRSGEHTVRERVDEDLRLTVKTRILRNDPPDVWVDWCGKNIEPYVASGGVGDVDDLWADRGFVDAFYESLQETVRVDGTYYGVPLNVQRTNCLFYKPTLLETWSIDPTDITDAREFLEVLEQADAVADVDGVLPLHYRAPWPALQLWGSLFLSQFGYEAYEDLVANGNAAAHRDAIGETFDLLASFAAYAPDDASYLSWMDANRRFMDDDVPFFYQGDWSAGPYNAAESFTYDEDWSVVPFPGTEDIYSMVLDGFLTAGTTDPAVEACLAQFGSREGIQTFNRIRGGVPTRSDVDTSTLHPFFREQSRSFERSRRVATSLAHGAGVDAGTLIDLKVATAEFVSTWDVDAGTAAFVESLSADR